MLRTLLLSIVFLFLLHPAFGQTHDTIHTYTFNVQKMGCRCIASIGGIWSEGDIRKEDLLNAGKIELEDCDTTINKIVSFNITLNAGGVTATKTVDGKIFSGSVKDFIRKANTGSVIMFKRIQVKRTDGKISNLNVILLHIL